MKIELTTEQVELLIKGEAEKLNEIFNAEKQKLETKFRNDLGKLESKLNSDLDSLKAKFKYIDYEFRKSRTPKTKDSGPKRKKMDVEKLKDLISQKKSIKEIAEILNTTQPSVRSKLYQLKIKLRDL